MVIKIMLLMGRVPCVLRKLGFEKDCQTIFPDYAGASRTNGKSVKIKRFLPVGNLPARLTENQRRQNN
jgi:hypothetical protein